MMNSVPGARNFVATGETYDLFMGRYSRPLAVLFADAADLAPGMKALDVGCGPGALTGVLVDRLGAANVAAIDPSPTFVEACKARHREVDVRSGRAETIPFEDQSFDRVLAQLVLHFVSEPARAAQELRRVLRPGGMALACVWDFTAGMEMLRHFWDAALALNPEAPDEARILRFGREREILDLFAATGFENLTETTLQVTSSYIDFDELWSGFLAGIGPAGAYCMSLSEEERATLRAELFSRLGQPRGAFSLGAMARCASGRAPA
ncbi:MAG TPA: methyltransferase domain-containing protein [Polyangiaceae bacterium]|nr:methyltransferase domain-containing protein [Polyangiaceae bacterium]